MGCNSGSEPVTEPFGSLSVNNYSVFPLSAGDMNKYLGHTSGFTEDQNSACPLSSICSSGLTGSWLRSADWSKKFNAHTVGFRGSMTTHTTFSDTLGLRPALRLQLGDLVLSADSVDQSQKTVGDLQLTFVRDAEVVTVEPKLSVKRENGKLKLEFYDGAATTTLGGAQTGWGWKLVDSGDKSDDASDDTVVASGKSNDGGNVVLPNSFEASHEYVLYYWGQEDGSAENGWSNKATEPVLHTLYTVTYELDGGKNHPDNPDGWFDRLESDMTLKTPTLLGHSFLGWYDNDQFTGSQVTKIPANSEQHYVLYAKWGPLEPATSLPFTGSRPLWWWLLIAVVLVAGCFTVLGRHRALNGFAVGYSLKHDGMRRDFSCPRHRRR
jgi:uncharacterized repeat protein (TIGR02543 family)